MDIRLDGKTALITGGSDGLGLAMGLKFAESGGNVILLARNKDRLEKAADLISNSVKGTQVRVEIISADVTDSEQISQAWKISKERFNQIDILVNIAGAHASGPFLEITDEMWQTDLDLKLFAAIR